MLLMNTGNAVVASSFTPASLTGLIAWWKADAGVTLSGSNVTGWADQSGNGHNLALATGGTDPTFSSTAFNTSFPGITFNGTSNGLSTKAAGAISLGGTTASCAAVFQLLSTVTINGRVLDFFGAADGADWNTTTSAVFIDGTSNTNLQAVRNSVTLVNQTTGANANLRVMSIFDGANFNMYLNNGTPTTHADTNTFAATGDIFMGCERNAGGTSITDTQNMVMAEAFYTNTAWSSTDRSNIDNYLKTRWGL